MFRQSRAQASLLESQFLLPKERRERLEKSWSQVFRTKVLPLIDEEPFRKHFEENNGRPNKSIRLLVALHLLKEEGDLTDEQVIEQLLFNLQWHHALGLEASEATVCQKTLHNFRVLLIEAGLLTTVFYPAVRKIVETEGLSVVFQRQDSTHVVSDIALLTRLGIFVETITCFLKELRRDAPDRIAALSPMYSKRYLERDGYFGDVKREEAKRRLPMVAQDLFDLVRYFQSDVKVLALESYTLLKRLLEEQCEVKADQLQSSAEAVVQGTSAKQDGETKPLPVVAEATTESASEQAKWPAEADGCDEKKAETLAKPARHPLESEAGSASFSAEPSVIAADSTRPQPATPAEESMEVADSVSSVPSQPAATIEVSTTAMPGSETVQLREPKEISSSSMQSPYDPDATYGHKGKGYEVQLVETCAEGNPFQVITHVEVQGAHVSDQTAVAPTLERLQQEGLKPETLFADTGYGSGENIVLSAAMGVDLQAPVRDPGRPETVDSRWVGPVAQKVEQQPPATEPQVSQPFTPSLADFLFAPDYQTVLSCPAGRTPDQQTNCDGQIEAHFDAATCAGCPLAGSCPARGQRGGGHRLKCRPAEAATAHRQAFQKTPQFKESYKTRSGIESTNSQLKGPGGADDLRVRGVKRVKLVMTFKALARNIFRMVDFNLEQIRGAMALAAAEA